MLHSKKYVIISLSFVFLKNFKFVIKILFGIFMGRTFYSICIEDLARSIDFISDGNDKAFFDTI